MGSLRVLQSVLLCLRIEVRSSRLEIGRITPDALGRGDICQSWPLVDVNPVLAWRQILEVQGNADAGSLRRQRGDAHTLSLSIFQVDLHWTLLRMKPGTTHEAQSTQKPERQDLFFHVCSSSPAPGRARRSVGIREILTKP